MRLRLMLLVLLALATGSAPLVAHHSFSASYQPDTSVTIQGELVQVILRNPHSFMHVIVRDRGTETRYAVEWNAAGDLGAQGVTRETLAIGDVIVVTGSPARTPSDNRIRLTSLRRPSDGFVWQQPARDRFVP
jgi:hypothetical protein